MLYINCGCHYYVHCSNFFFFSFLIDEGGGNADMPVANFDLLTAVSLFRSFVIRLMYSLRCLLTHYVERTNL